MTAEVVAFRPRKVSASALEMSMRADEEREQNDRLHDILRRLHLHIVSGNAVAAYHVLTREADPWFVRHGRRWHGDGGTAA